MEASVPISIQSNTLFQALALNGTSLVVLNSENTVTWANDSAQALFDREIQSDLVGNKWEQLIQIDGKSVWDSGLEEEFRRNAFLKTDGYFDAGSRGRVAIELVICPNEGSDERIIMIRDVTVNKAHEDELEVEKKNAELLNLALETEIEKANELAVMAERANIAKSVFLTSMSHEFRTPLNGILGYAQIMGVDDRLSEDHRKAAATIERCGQHLLSIINDVLDLSKIEAGKVEVAHEPLNINELIADVVDVFKVRATTKGLELNCEFSLNNIDLEWIIGDEKLIRQVLMNLIGNAVKFTDRGSISLLVEAQKVDQNDHLRTQVNFSVIDTGPGIDKKFLEQVFEEFYQTEAFSGHKGGTGLGLAISKKLAVAMGGRLFVESKLGEGSSFQFMLPTRRVVQSTEAKGLGVETESLCFVDSDIVFLQTSNEDLDSGVMEAVFKSMGLSDDKILYSDRSIEALDPSSHENWIIGSAISDLTEADVRQFYKWVPKVKGTVVLLLYIDRSQSKPHEQVENLIVSLPKCISVEIPINVPTFKRELVQKCPDLFEKRERVAGVVTSNESVLQTQSLSDLLPDRPTLKSLLQDAQIGDMRGLTNKLDVWVVNSNSSSHFEMQIKQMIEAFKIDELCDYIQHSLQEGESNGASNQHS